MFMLALSLLACRNKDSSWVVDTAALVDDSAPADDDGDGFFGEEDCDDSDANVHPDAQELCDGIDNNCDGSIDEDSAADAGSWYADLDGDGYGDLDALSVSCSAPSGSVAQSGDCDDNDAAYYPGAPEEDCTDPNDYNCDGSVGYEDADGDGWAACVECDDTNAAVHPDATEVCNGLDDDCDTFIDEDDAADASTWYADSDSDGYGDPASASVSCEQPSGSVADDSDCDDTSNSTYPGADEYCDGVDTDCDGTLDADDALDAGTWYADGDGDGYGDPSSSSLSCEQPSGSVADATDCDDASSDTFPGADEYCDGVDTDCDGTLDESDALDADTWYTDSDGDGYGDPATATVSCDAPSGAISDSADCDDSDADVNPDALELCDGLDNDCDGVTDPDDSWWDADYAYRVPLTLSASAYDVDGPPVMLHADFAQALSELGVSGSLDADSVRVVLQDCSLSLPELPSQFEEEFSVLSAAADHSDPAGDDAGLLAFVYDQDGDTSSLETLSASSSVELAVYFDTTAPSTASYSGSLAVTTTSLENGLSAAAFDTSAGGLLESFVYGTNSSWSSQTDSCCGNGAYVSAWTSTPMYDTATNTVEIEGEVLSMVHASGAIANYDYDYWYWMFDGRPELWVKTEQATTSAVTMSHSADFTDGIRPWESRQDNLASTTHTADTSYEYADSSDASGGISMGYHQAPLYLTGLSAYNPYFIFLGNDYAPSGSGSPVTVPAGTTFMDNNVMVLLPHDGAFTDSSDGLFGLMEGVSVSQGSAEAQ